MNISNDGIAVESTTSNTKFIINSQEAKVVNKTNDETQVSFNGDKTIIKRALLEDELTVGKLRFTSLNNGDVMCTFDD